MDFGYPQGMHFPQKYYHNRLFELFSNKNKCLKMKMESSFHTSLDFFLTFFDKCFG